MNQPYLHRRKPQGQSGLFVTLMLLALLAAACGTLQVDVEPQRESATPQVSMAEPTATGGPEPEPQPTADVATDEPDPAVQESSPQPEQIETEPDAEQTSSGGLDSLALVYNKENNVWLWTGKSEPQALTRNGGVEGLRISDDGQRIAFMRGGNLWTVHADGSDERQLTEDADFEDIDFGPDLNPFVLAVTPYQFAWLPDSHQLIFNTAPQFDGPGLILTDDLWTADVDNELVDQLLPAGEGGSFTISPDGRQIALIRPGSVELVDPDGSNRREAFTHTPVITYSEFQYYAQPVWEADSSAMNVAIPPTDSLSTPGQPTTIWRIPADGRPASLLGHIQTAPGLNAQTAFSPDLSQVAYLTGDQPPGAPGAEPLGIAIATIGADRIGDGVAYPADADSFQSWSPDSVHFVYTPPFSGTPRLHIGALGKEPIMVGDGQGAVFSLKWISNDQYIYLQQGGRGWAIVIGTLDGSEVLSVDSVAGTPPSFDIVVPAGFDGLDLQNAAEPEPESSAGGQAIGA